MKLKPFTSLKDFGIGRFSNEILKGLRYGQNYRYMYSNVYLKLIEFLIKMLSFLEERHILKVLSLVFKTLID